MDLKMKCRRTCPTPTAHVWLHDSVVESSRSLSPLTVWQQSRPVYWSLVLQGIVFDYGLKSQSTPAPKEAVFISGLRERDWLTALPAPRRLPLYVCTGTDLLGFCSPGGQLWRPGWHWQRAAAWCHLATETLRTKASLVATYVFNIAFQSCGKEKTASDRCQANLLQLTCAANVEPSDPDLDGNHCKYFPARPVEDSFNGASHRGIKLTVNDSNCLHFVSSVPKL